MFLQRQGLVIIDRNVRIRRGEVDILADDGDCRVVVEVKTVAGRTVSIPEDAFTDEKARTVRRLASELRPRARRVDLVAVSLIDSGARVRWLRAIA